MNNTPTFTSINDAKYKNMRVSLLAIVIFSAINLISITLTQTYFLFSAYLFILRKIRFPVQDRVCDKPEGDIPESYRFPLRELLLHNRQYP